MSISIGGNNSYINQIASQANTNARKAGADRVSSSASGISSDSSREELTEAVKGFEQYFVEEILKTMKDSTKMFSGDDKSDSLTDYYMDFAVREVASQMVEEYGGRITEDFVDQIQRNYGIKDVDA